MDSWQDLRHTLETVRALVNTSPDIAGDDELGDVSAVGRFINAHTITEVERATLADLGALHNLRRKWRAIFASGGLATRTALINEALATARIEPRLVDHDDLGLHLHYFPPFATLSEHLNADCAMALALLLVAGESDRMRVCAAPDCSRVLIDYSRNRSRFYCDSRTCGNRLHAAAYRARQRQ